MGAVEERGRSAAGVVGEGTQRWPWLGSSRFEGNEGVGGCPGREDALAKSQDRRDPEKRGSAGQRERTSSCLKLPEEGRIKAAEAGGQALGSPGDPGFRRGVQERLWVRESCAQIVSLKATDSVTGFVGKRRRLGGPHPASALRGLLLRRGWPAWLSN